MPADVAFCQRAVNGIAQRVDGDIGVRVAGQARLVRDMDAAEHQRAARFQGMHVKPGADPGGAGEQSCHAGKILRMGELDVVLRAGNERHGQPGGFQQSRTIRGGAVSLHGCLPMQAEQRGEPEPLRRLGPVQMLPRDRRRDPPRLAAFQRVCHRHRRNGALHVRQRRDDAPHHAGRYPGTAAVMDQDQVRPVRHQRLQPGQHARLPRGAARYRWQMREFGERRRDRGRVAHGLQHGHMRHQRSRGMCQHGAAEQR